MTTKQELQGHILKAQAFGEWIYHDMRLDCDDEANSRTHERLILIDEQFGKDAIFGIAGWWAVSSYWRLEEAHRARGLSEGPDLTPKNVEAILADEKEPVDKRRAFVSAQQFISTLTHDDIEMSYAIFGAAYEAGRESWLGLMYSVVILSIRISNLAQRVKTSRGK